MSNVVFENTPLPDIVELKNISQTYDGGQTHVIKDLNLLIEDKPDQGQFISLLGPSGCGKSTLLRYICGLQTPTTGEVLIGAKPRTKEDRIGMVFQKYSSLPWLTVLQNVELGLKFRGVPSDERRERAMVMINSVGLLGHEGKYAQYPNLSGGQLQRVAIARSLLANSNILVMDEPFGALDIKTRLTMQDLMLKIWSCGKSNTTIIFVTHDISEAVYLSDEIMIMSTGPGSIVERINIPFGKDRKREMKRDSGFKDIVNSIEDKMMQLGTKK
jgi:NitT/TauT family transport system ATP-binding protein